MFPWILSQSRCLLRKWCKGVESNNDRALPPPRIAPKERSNIQFRELCAWDKRPQRKISEGSIVAQTSARVWVAEAKSSQPVARAAPLIAPAEAPPMIGKGLPSVRAL